MAELQSQPPNDFFDLDFLVEFATDVGLRCSRESETHATVHLVEGYQLCFGNLPEADDVILYFGGVDSGWHSHGAIIVASDENVAEVPINVLSQLLHGKLLICHSVFSNGEWVSLVDPSEHHGFKDLQPGERTSLVRIAHPHLAS